MSKKSKKHNKNITKPAQGQTTKRAVKQGSSYTQIKSDPWEKDFLKEVEQAEQTSEAVEFDEKDLEIETETEAEAGKDQEPEIEVVEQEEQTTEEAEQPEENVSELEAEVEPEQNEYDPAGDLASDADLKLLAEAGVGQRNPSLLHKINVKLPWLKVILMIIAIAALAVFVGKFVESQIVGLGASGGDTTGAVLGEQTAVEHDPESSEEVETVVEAEPVASAIPEATIPPEGGAKLVALTFDDGPSGTTTWRLLDILAEKQVRVTFFVLGNMVLKNPDLLKAELAAGHEVGSHTATHANLSKSTASSIRWEGQRMNEIFQEVTGGPGPAIMRPPYGAVNDTVRSQAGLPMILWTVDTEDWRYRDSAEVRRRALAGVFDGAIILMHDTHATTVDAVAGIIDDLRAAGYTIVTVSQMAAERGVALQNGRTYGSFRP